MTRDEMIERQCNNMATGAQMREFLRNDDGNEPPLRELLRLNLEQFYKSVRREQDEEIRILREAILRTLKTIRSGSLIIPNRGLDRDRATAAYDTLLAAMNMKPGDISALPPEEEVEHPTSG